MPLKVALVMAQPAWQPGWPARPTAFVLGVPKAGTSSLHHCLVEEFGAEAREILARHAKHKKEMLDIMALMEAEFNEQEGEARQQFDSDREEIKGKGKMQCWFLEGLGSQEDAALLKNSSRSDNSLAGRSNSSRGGGKYG